MVRLGILLERSYYRGTPPMCSANPYEKSARRAVKRNGAVLPLLLSIEPGGREDGVVSTQQQHTS